MKDITESPELIKEDAVELLALSVTVVSASPVTVAMVIATTKLEYQLANLSHLILN
ncbi:hypothetical protein CHS0354_026286, partial [Potamilus streckersoni]